MTTRTIGELADAAGVTAKTIRFHEEKGMLPPARRSGSGYRLYGDADIRRLRLIR
ncbi:MAG: MerR family transcriptional regulator [Dehalococcoidia bacterium]|nr:MerR family transcriptional regulator [Dehalococcoidia bacterium]